MGAGADNCFGRKREKQLINFLNNQAMHACNFVFLKHRLKDSIFSNCKKLQKFEDKQSGKPNSEISFAQFKKLLQTQKTIPKYKVFLHLLLSHSNTHWKPRNPRQFRKLNQFKQRGEEAVFDDQVILAMNTDVRSWRLRETCDY